MKSKTLYYKIMPIIMVFTLIISLFAPLVPINLASAAEINATGLSASDAKVTDSNEKEITSTDTTSAYSDYSVTYNWSIPSGQNISDGDTITFEVPSYVKIVKDQSMDVYGNGQIIGTAEIKAGATTGTITITNAEGLKINVTTGHLTIEAKGINSNGTDSPYMINKVAANWVVDGSSSEAGWEILYNPDGKELTNAIVTDQLQKKINLATHKYEYGQTYVEGSVKVYEGTVDKANNNYFTSEGEITDKVTINIDNTNGTMTIDLGNISKAIKIDYATKPNSDFKGYLGNSAHDANGQSSGTSQAWQISSADIDSYNGVASLKKVSSEDTSKGLSGAVFKIIDKNDNDADVVTGLTTDSNGEVSVNNLANGKYAFVETKAPDGYDLDSTEYPFEISESNRSDTTYVTNPIEDTPTKKSVGKATLTKVDADDAKTVLKGAVFKVINTETGKAVQENLTTDDKGQVTVDGLSNGKYAFVETEAPSGYEVDSTEHPFTISDDHQTDNTYVDSPITNKLKPVGKATLVKTDAETKKALAGAVFKVINTDTGDIVKENLTTNDEGQVTVDGLSNGKYAFVETKAPDGYELDNTEHSFTITDEKSNDAVEVPVTNESTTTSITVNKAWNDNNNQDGKRPDSVIVKLLANGEDTGKTVTLSDDNKWSGSFDNLDKKDSDGKAIQYSVQENVPEGYISSASGAVDVADGGSVTITNTPTTDIQVTKNWVGDENYTAFRQTVEAQLLANGEPAAGFSNISLSESNGWTNSFKNLPKYDSEGKEITYSVKEVTALPNYESTVSDVKDGQVIITNTYQPTQITVTKKWEDNDNQDGKRPSSIDVTLYQESKDTEKTKVETKTITPDKDGNWTTSFTNLPKKDANGNEISYSLEEAKVSDYTANVEMSGNEATITNTHTPETTSLEVNKTWKDNDDQDGKRPDSVQVQLYKSVNGEQPSAVEGQTITLNKENSWKASFAKLPVYENGQKITYSVKEANEVPGYTEEDGDVDTTNNTVTITNTHTPEVTSLKVNKVWDDVQNVDKLRPKQVTVKLYQDGNPTDKTITLNADNSWTSEFSNLPVYQNGKQVTYSVKEVNDKGEAVDNPVTDYEKPEYKTNSDGSVTITNSHKQETTELTVKKQWADDTGYEAFRKGVTVQLYKNGVAFRDPITLNTGNNWSYKFTDLPKNDENGEIKYTVKETNTSELPNYTASLGEVKNNAVTITNTFNPINLAVNKVWDDNNNQDGKQAASVTVHLLANGKDTGKSVVLSAKNDWTASFTSLNKYDENGNKITYSVNEDAVDGYKTTISELKDGKITVTNTHTPEVTSLKVNKVWDDNDDQDGKRPSSVEVTLYKTVNGKKTAVKTITLAANKDKDKNWQAEFTNLPVYESGKKITYSLEEKAVDGYKTTISDIKDKQATITNTHIPATTNLKVNKIWKDDNNSDNTRPKQIKVTLYGNGEPTGYTVTLNAENNWHATFNDIPVYANGEVIAYSVKEEPVANYITSYKPVGDAINITNTLTKKSTTHLTVNKVWVDNNNKEKVRPNSVTVKLLANGKETGKTIVLSDKNNWTATFSDLAKKDENGKEITYTVKEVPVDEYISKTSEVKDNAVTITNTIIPNTPPVKPTKPETPNKPNKPNTPTTPPVKPTKDSHKKSTIEKMIDQLLPQTGESRNHTVLTYVGLLVVLVVIISWGIVIIRKRKNK